MKIHKIKNIFPRISVARYNLAVWQKPHKDSLYFIGREVAKPGEVGEPDTGVLKLFEAAPNGSIIKEKVIWKPISDAISLEDPRALALPERNLVIGLTAVLRNREGHPLPFPAIVKIDSLNTWKQELPPLLIIDTFGPGKNLTPIDTSTYLFRPDSEDYHHKLIVFSLHSQIPEKLGEIEFPKDIPWALWRVGTTMPPLWITKNQALFLIHGITIQKIQGKEKYVYSIGRAKLTRKGKKYSVTVEPVPILTPDDFLGKDGLPFVEELHPDLRRVVYSCGGVVKRDDKDTLSLYVNVGDRTTFQVDFSLKELKEGLF